MNAAPNVGSAPHDNTGPHDEAQSCCLKRASMMWAGDEILFAARGQRRIPTAAIDQLPPWRALLYVRVADAAGAPLEQGTMEQLHQAARDAGGDAPPGWWRAALGLPPEPPEPPRRTNQGRYIPPAGWKVIPKT